MNSRSKIAIFTVFTAFCAIFLSGCQTKANIGYYNGSRLIKESPKLDSVYKEGMDKIQKQQQELMSLNQNLAQGIIKEEEYQKKYQELTKEVEKIGMNYSTKLKTIVDEEVSKIAKEKELDAVLNNLEVPVSPTFDRKGKLIVTGGTDITEDLIERLR